MQYQRGYWTEIDFWKQEGQDLVLFDVSTLIYSIIFYQ